MDAADLSAWFGKPPNSPKVQENGEPADDTESGVESSREKLSPEETEAADAGNSDIEQPQSDGEERDELVLSSEDESFGGRTSRLHNGFFIHIPRIPNKDDYEHLPGHFTVDRVLSEYPGDKYLVKLGSGEIELVRVSKFSHFPFLHLHIIFISTLSSNNLLIHLSFRLDSFA
jgi:hypothetical protein